MPLLFSYGSNTPEQLSERLGRPLGKLYAAYLPKYRRVYRGWSTRWEGGTATIKADSKETIYGYATEVTDADLARLDIPEGALMRPPKTKRKTLMIKVLANGQGTRAVNRQAVLYVSTSTEFNPPSREYLLRVCTTVSTFWRGSDGKPVTPEDFRIS